MYPIRGQNNEEIIIINQQLLKIRMPVQVVPFPDGDKDES